MALFLSGTGGIICSGSLINNLCNENIPYFLTANHCLDSDALDDGINSWQFIFQFWSYSCNPSQDPHTMVMFNGSTVRARNAPSDFALVELHQRPTSLSPLVFSGWNRSSVPATSATGIHHPSGDVMKISRDHDPLVRSSAFGQVNQHWQVLWDVGVTEGGSSGSPLYDQDHRIIGQLQGGISDCGSSVQRDHYGSFDQSWTGGWPGYFLFQL